MVDKVEEKLIIEWFNKEFWINYPNDLCQGKRGSKGMALKSALKINPDKDERTRILQNLKAQIRFFRRENRPDRWKHAVTYLNNRLYDDEIESVIDQRERNHSIELPECSHPDCHFPVHGGKYKSCAKHVIKNKEDKFADRKVELMEEAGLLRKLGESLHDHAMRCRQSANSLGGVGAAISKMCEPDPQIR